MPTLTQSQLRTILKLAQRIHKEEDFSKEDSLDEAYRRLGLSRS